MPTIDANVWVAAFDTKDRFHDESVVFLRSLAPLLHLEPLDEGLLSEALRLGTTFRLRAADALYAATASLGADGVLVSWDNELIERAGAATPTAWLAAHR